jgi:hypothetical protein
MEMVIEMEMKWKWSDLALCSVNWAHQREYGCAAKTLVRT